MSHAKCTVHETLPIIEITRLTVTHESPLCHIIPSSYAGAASCAPSKLRHPGVLSLMDRDNSQVARYQLSTPSRYKKPTIVHRTAFSMLPAAAMWLFLIMTMSKSPIR